MTTKASTELLRLVDACLVPGFDGADVPDWLRRAAEGGLGGVCVYGPNIEAAGGELARLVSSLSELRPDLLVAVDEEGGDVTRLHYTSGSSSPGNLALGAIDDVDLTRDVATALASELAALGVNLVYAPSVDVNSDPRNPVIGVRSFGDDAQLVARHGAAAIEGIQACGIAACAKHFPGHGATRTDTHLGLPTVDCDERTLRQRELVPFIRAVDAGVAAIMTAHVVFPVLDDMPATLSRRMLTGLLRNELGFTGVVSTDALEMGALQERWGIAGAAVRALAAGCDQLVLGSQNGEAVYHDVRATIVRAVVAGELPVRRLEEASERVAALALRVAAPSKRRDDLAALGLEAARRALRVEAEPLERAPFVVTLRGEANGAVGAAPWGLERPLAELDFLAGAADLGEGGGIPDTPEAPLVISCRDAYRSEWQRDAIAVMRSRRPDATLVAMGMPNDRELTDGPFVATHGAARACAIAAAEALRGR
jgi:beta-N-acetylhexosaminidase